MSSRTWLPGLDRGHPQNPSIVLVTIHRNSPEPKNCFASGIPSGLESISKKVASGCWHPGKPSPAATAASSTGSSARHRISFFASVSIMRHEKCMMHIDFTLRYTSCECFRMPTSSRRPPAQDYAGHHESGLRLWACLARSLETKLTGDGCQVTLGLANMHVSTDRNVIRSRLTSLDYQELDHQHPDRKKPA